MKLGLRFAALASLVVLALILAPSSLAEPAATPSNAFTFTHRVMELTNQQRVAEGRAPLQWNDTLAACATSYANDMATRGFFAHISPEGTNPSDRGRVAGYPSFDWGTYVGENLAMGFNDPDDVMQGWMNSESHRYNLLLPNYTEIGVGLAVAPNGTVFWAQEFGDSPADHSQ